MRLVLALVSYFIFVSTVILINNDASKQDIYATNRATPAVLSAVSEETRPYLEAINELRINNGAKPVLFSARLEAIANQRVAEMSLSYTYSHTRNDGSSFSSLLPKETQIKYACENLQLQTSSSLEEALQAWMSSSVHKNCLLSDNISSAGLSYMIFGNLANNEEEHVVFTFIGAN